MTSREPARCGTDSGYDRHKRNGTRPCVACCDAHAAYQREWAARPRHAATPRRPCGTVAAYQRHRNHGERPCGACREAKRIASATRRQLVAS